VPDQDVVVVGGGLAGLAAAIELADSGQRVTLLEARPRLGGATASFTRDGVTIDTGALLMDQAVMAGVGNVYRAEVLYRAGLSPFRMGRDVSAAEFSALWVDLVTLMKLGVRDGRIVTTAPADRPPGRRRRPTRDDAHYVYRRTGEPCRRCGTPVRTAIMAARNLYWCPVCQK
jgi:endonuclease VIII